MEKEVATILFSLQMSGLKALQSFRITPTVNNSYQVTYFW